MTTFAPGTGRGGMALESVTEVRLAGFDASPVFLLMASWVWPKDEGLIA